MTQWMPYAVVLCAALILGVATQAAAQSQDQQGDSQQTTSQQQSQQNQQKQQEQQDHKNQMSGKQSGAGDKQGSGGDKQGSASGQISQAQKALFINRQESSQVLASTIMGLTIKNSSGKKAEDIGTVNDLIMNKQHQLVGIVVGIGGFLGIGEKNVGVKWQAVENLDPEKGIAVVTVSKKQLQNAPAFTSKEEQKQQKKQEKAKKKAREQQKSMQQPKQGQQQQTAPAQSDNAATGG